METLERLRHATINWVDRHIIAGITLDTTNTVSGTNNWLNDMTLEEMKERALKLEAEAKKDKKLKTWWMLDREGNIDMDFAFRPKDANPLDEKRSPYVPWGRNFNHVHRYSDDRYGVHMFGTLEEAKEEWKKANEGKSELPIQDR